MCVRRRSDSKWLPGSYRGLLILGCILFVLFPVISISEDVARKQVLTISKATESSHPTPAVAELKVFVPSWGFAFWRESENGQESFGMASSVDPNIENRPPPQYVCV